VAGWTFTNLEASGRDARQGITTTRT
jgi:hypothetical protein